jgi:glycosyltransferase involved in cell wall biosynthesis
MSLGVPAIVSRVGGLPEVIADGVDGMLVPAGDSSALQQRMEALIRDPALAERLGAAAQKTLTARFTLETMVSEYERIYQAVFEGRQAGTKP